MSMLSEIVALVGVVSAPIGGAVVWVWTELKAFKRETRAELDEARADLEQCRLREARDQERRVIEQQRRGIHRTVIELFWQEIARISPDSAVLGRGQKLMSELEDKDEEIAVKDRELDPSADVPSVA